MCIIIVIIIIFIIITIIINMRCVTSRRRPRCPGTRRCRPGGLPSATRRPAPPCSARPGRAPSGRLYTYTCVYICIHIYIYIYSPVQTAFIQMPLRYNMLSPNSSYKAWRSSGAAYSSYSAQFPLRNWRSNFCALVNL